MAILGGITVAKAGFEVLGANAKEEQIETQKKQYELQYTQKSLSNLDKLQKVLDAQIAQSTVRGVSLDSASLEAIERNTMNIGARSQRNLNLEQSLIDQNLAMEQSNVKTSLYAQLFGDAATLALNYANYNLKYGSMK